MRYHDVEKKYGVALLRRRIISPSIRTMPAILLGCRLVHRFIDMGSVLALRQVAQYGNAYLNCVSKQSRLRSWAVKHYILKLKNLFQFVTQLFC